MADLNDLKGPYQDKLDLKNMSKDWLIGLLNVWHHQYGSLMKGLFTALLTRMPPEEAAKIVVEAVSPMMADNQELIVKLAGIEPKTFLDLNSIARLSLDGDAMGRDGRFESKETIFSPNHMISEVRHCPYLEDMEAAGAPPEMQTLVCYQVEEPLMHLVYHQNNPRMPRLKITQLKGGARKSKDELCCKFEFQIVDEKGNPVP